MTRQVRPTQEERERLSAIGFTKPQILAEASARAVIPITIGSLLGAAVAVLGSGQFPFGFVRVLEPHPGIRVDWLVVLAGAAVFIVALTLWTVGALALSGRQNRAVRPSSAGRGAGHPERQCDGRRRPAIGVQPASPRTGFGSWIGRRCSAERCRSRGGDHLRSQPRSSRASTGSIRLQLRRLRRRQRCRDASRRHGRPARCQPRRDIADPVRRQPGESRRQNDPDTRPRSGARRGTADHARGAPAGERRRDRFRSSDRSRHRCARRRYRRFGRRDAVTGVPCDGSCRRARVGCERRSRVGWNRDDGRVDPNRLEGRGDERRREPSSQSARSSSRPFPSSRTFLRILRTFPLRSPTSRASEQSRSCSQPCWLRSPC